MEYEKIEFLLDIVSDEQFIKISKEVNLRIDGFRNIQKKHGIFIPPKKILIKEILKDSYLRKIDELILNTSNLNIEIKPINILYDLDNDKKKLLIETLLDIKSLNPSCRIMIKSVEIDIDVLKIQLLGEDTDKIVNYTEKIELMQKDINTLKEKLNRFEQVNKSLEIEKLNLKENVKDLKKQNNLLYTEKLNQKSNLDNYIKENKKIKDDYYTLKRKYDEINIAYKSNQLKFKESLSIIEELNQEKIELQNNVLSLKNENKKLKNKDSRKIIVFGEIPSRDKDLLKEYEILEVNIDRLKEVDINNSTNKIYQIWLLSYGISYADKLKIIRYIDKDRIRNFISYNEFKKYLNEVFLK